MSLTTIEEAQRSREFYARRARRMDALRVRGALLVGGSYLAAATALALAAGVGRIPVGTAVLYVLALAVAGNFRFDVGAGFTVPTQAVFVPMLFALPASLVPLLVPLGLALGMAPQIARRELTADWLLNSLANSWFAIGPALVLVLAHDHQPNGRWAVLLLALLAQFTCDFLASVVRERLYRGPRVRELLTEYRPVYAIDIALSALGLLVADAAIVAHDQLAVLLIAPLFAMLRLFSRERHERLQQMAELNDAYQGTALMLGDVVEADDAYTGEHCKSVVALSLAVARELGLDPERTRNVEFGALLHDVGKLSVPNEIINKPGPLDQDEWEVIKRHTIEGQRMLERIGGFMSHIGIIVRASHERWDGNGYPDGLIGQEIPLEARIVAACDAFNAMTTTRSYREAMGFADARAELVRSAGSHFDPDVVRALLAVVAREAPQLSAVSEPRAAPDAEPARAAGERSLTPASL
ncbi:MAG TPA: HD-GYP domain-containing protein [Solirubrobacteraceae bacterium]|nr:HD-GYP domain-containing protein [Solirubrobacteraceae bacterium]